MKPVLFLLSLILLAACGNGGPDPALQMGDQYALTPDGVVSQDDAATSPGDDIPGGTDGSPGAEVMPESDAAVQPDVGCVASCTAKQCGSDGCGGSCGTCEAGVDCVKNICVPPCDHPGCSLGKLCIDSLNQAALCGGTLDFDHDLGGKKLGVDINVESLYGSAGVLIATVEADSVAATNPYEVKSPSGNNSCASVDEGHHYWLDDLIIRFVLPDGNGWLQGVTHYVSLYIAQTIPGGIRVDFFAPDSPPGLPGSAPFKQLFTQQQGTALVELMSPKAIGYIKVLKADDPDFTIDDLSFGPVTAY